MTPHTFSRVSGSAESCERSARRIGGARGRVVLRGLQPSETARPASRRTGRRSACRTGKRGAAHAPFLPANLPPAWALGLRRSSRPGRLFGDSAGLLFERAKKGAPARWVPTARLHRLLCRFSHRRRRSPLPSGCSLVQGGRESSPWRCRVEAVPGVRSCPWGNRVGDGCKLPYHALRPYTRPQSRA